MRRIIKFSEIGEIALKLKQQIEELKKDRNELLIDVNKIDEGYKGKDASIVIGKYKEKISEIDIYTATLEKYQICLEWLSGSYRDSHNKAKNNLNTDMEAEDLTGQTVMLKNITPSDATTTSGENVYIKNDSLGGNTSKNEEYILPSETMSAAKHERLVGIPPQQHEEYVFPSETMSAAKHERLVGIPPQQHEEYVFPGQRGVINPEPTVGIPPKM